MDHNALDRLARTVARSASRRGMLASAVGLGGLVASWDDGDAKKHKKKKHKKCGPCRIKKRGKCKGAKADGTECGSSCLTCQSGVCTAKTGEACGEGRVCLPNGSCAETCTSNPECPAVCFCNDPDFNPDQAQVCLALTAPPCDPPPPACDGPEDCPVGQACYRVCDFVNRCYNVCPL